MAPSQIPSFWEAAKVWARIGCLSFGGPAGQIALMHKVLVEEPAVRARRLLLCARTLLVLETGLHLLGLRPLRRM